MNTELETTATRVAMASQSLAPGEPLCTEAVDLALSRIAASADGDVGAIDALAALAFVEGNPMNLDQARKDFSSCNILLIPVCYKDHWVLYTYDDYDAKVRRYDSCWGKSAAADEGVYTLLSSLFERDMKKISGDVEHVSVPHQPNNFDCGVCVLLFAYAASREGPVEPSYFTLEALYWFRRVLTAEIVLPPGEKMPEWVFQRGEELLAHCSGYCAAHDLANDAVSRVKRTLGNKLDALLITCMTGRVTAGTISLWKDELWVHKTESEEVKAALDGAIHQFSLYQTSAATLLQEAEELYQRLLQEEQ